MDSMIQEKVIERESTASLRLPFAALNLFRILDTDMQREEYRECRASDV